MIKKNLPNDIAIFPLSGAVFYPRTILPLNIFEDRYISLVNDCMKGNRMFGMVQPKVNEGMTPKCYEVGCLGKIISLNETSDKRFIINLSGIIRFRIEKELKNHNLYRKFSVNYFEFLDDLNEKKNQLKNNNQEILLKKIKIFFEKVNHPVRYSELTKLNIDQLINTISMIFPFSVTEKQKLIETIKIEDRVQIIDEIISFNLFEIQENKTIQ